MQLMKYVGPSDETGAKYYVPCVVKNKDFLVGFIDSCHINQALLNTALAHVAFKTIGSNRFNDVTRDNRRLRFMSIEDIKQYAYEQVELMMTPSDVLDDKSEVPILNYYYDVSCTCGNYFGFNNKSEIPDQKLICNCCGKLLIDYTQVDDDTIAYDGVDGKDNVLLNELMYEISAELYDFEEDEDDDEDDDFHHSHH